MHTLAAALAIAGSLVMAIAILSKTIKLSVLSEPIVAVLVGVIVGPAVLGWLDPAGWGPTETVMTTATRLTLAIGLMGVALRIAHEDFRAVWRPVAVLLTIGMLGMWALSALAASLWLGVGLWMALLIGAVVTPTDPIVASAIVTGPLAETLLPQPVKGSLSLESGANDGLAFLLVMLPVIVLTHTGPTTTAVAWLVQALLQGVLLAVVIGAALGYVAARLLRWTKARKRIETHSLLSYTVALSLATLGIARLAGSDALIATFIAGIVFNLTSDTSQQHQEENIQEAINKLFSIPIFILFGAVLPWAGWLALGWPLAGLALTVLLVRRPPVFLALAPVFRRFYAPREIAFLGWFGPIGIAALFYGAHAWERTGDPLAWHVGSAVVLASIVAHGVSASPLTKVQGRGGKA